MLHYIRINIALNIGMCSSRALKQASQTTYESNTMGFCFTPRVICLAGKSVGYSHVNPDEENWIHDVAASSQADYTAPLVDCFYFQTCNS